MHYQRSIDEIVTPIENEIEGTEELVQIMRRNVDDVVDKKYLTREIEENYRQVNLLFIFTIEVSISLFIR